MHGLGNDFVVLDGREQPIAMTPALAKALADRQLGIGCDQLILLEPSTTADVKMRIWNHDGGEVQSCGNASRCVVALTGAKTPRNRGGMVEGGSFGAEVEVSLPPPHFAWDEVPLNYPMDTAKLPLAWGPLEHPMALSVGNPHLVFFVPDEKAIDLDSSGPVIEHDPAFPERINVNVASGARRRHPPAHLGARRRPDAGLRHRRLRHRRRGDRPEEGDVSRSSVHMRGGELTISWAPGEPIRMRGTATHVFKGEIDLEQFA